MIKYSNFIKVYLKTGGNIKGSIVNINKTKKIIYFQKIVVVL